MLDVMVDNIIEYLEYKESVLFATFSVYYNRGATLESLHEYINELKEKWTNDCLNKFSRELDNDTTRRVIINILRSKGADKNYSSKKFMHAFYNKIINYKISNR